MGLTQRQQQILESAVGEYINLAQPVSSQWLEQEYDFGVSPATIRNELLVLSEKGFLVQPHTSAGRVPTDKGYRFFVNKLLAESVGTSGPWLNQGAPWFSQEGQDSIAALQELARELSLASSLFAAVAWEKLLWKEGWESLFLQPEFEEKQMVLNFTRFLEDFEKNLENLPFHTTLHIAIGKENRFSKMRDFSIMVADCAFPGMEHIVVALLGPKRMAYKKNIHLLESLLDSQESHGKRD